MKPKPESTLIPEKPWPKLSPEQIASGIEWLERTQGDNRPVSQEQQSTQPDKSPQLSEAAQSVHDAMLTLMPTPEAAAAAAEYNRSFPRPTKESLEQMRAQMLDNLNRNAMLGGKARTGEGS